LTGTAEQNLNAIKEINHWLDEVKKRSQFPLVQDAELILSSPEWEEEEESAFK